MLELSSHAVSPPIECECGDAEGVQLHAAALAAAEQQNALKAIELLDRAIRAAPGRFGWLLDLATLQYAAGRWANCADTLESSALAGRLSPANLRLLASALLHRAQELRDSGDLITAVEALERCVAADPLLPGAHATLASIFSSTHYHFLARKHREHAASLAPNDRDARLWLARSQFQTGETGACIQSLSRLVEEGDSSELRSELLHVLLHDPQQAAATLRAAHQRWEETSVTAGAVLPAHTNLQDPERRLRIGYLCGEFYSAPSAHFLMPLIRFRNRIQFHLTCYYTGPRRDAFTGAYMREADRWRTAAWSTDAQLAGQIRDDAIDILVHLSGHYEHHRLSVLSERPAPLQAVFPNYPSTTGVSAAGHILTDRWVCPEGSENQYCEAAIHIPEGYLSYLPPRNPEITAPPCGNTGPITFGVFQRPAKYHPGFWDVVAQILTKCPGSTLLLQFASRELDHLESSVCEQFRSIMQDRGIDPASLRLRGPLGPAENLEFFAGADIALDTFPYNGQTTTCECLWMGVPVISLAGQSHVARVGLSILSRIGLSDLVAHSPSEYVECATRLAADRSRLTTLRRGLRERMGASSLMNGQSIAGIEREYRRLWRDWCAPHRKMESKCQI
jgi:protein O-GlcNAc transferase